MRSLILIAMLPLAACSFETDAKGAPATGSGDARQFAVADFSGVVLRGSDDVDVRVGPAFSVSATGPSAVLDVLKIERDGDTLKIGRRNRTGINWGPEGHAKIHVTMPRIVAASVAGSGDMAIDRVAGDRFKGGTAGSGNLRIGALAVKAANLDIAGSGGIVATGSAESLALSIAGSGDIDAPGLKASGATASVAGSGSIRAAVAGDASVNIVGSGDVDLGPQARCTTTKMGSGSVRCGG